MNSEVFATLPLPSTLHSLPMLPPAVESASRPTSSRAQLAGVLLGSGGTGQRLRPKLQPAGEQLAVMRPARIAPLAPSWPAGLRCAASRPLCHLSPPPLTFCRHTVGPSARSLASLAWAPPVLAASPLRPCPSLRWRGYRFTCARLRRASLSWNRVCARERPHP